MLALVLLALVPIIGTGGMFSADEGAAVAQAKLLADGDGWTMAHPFPAADPSGQAFPIELSQRNGDRYAPFVKHPLYALLLAGADRAGGRGAMLVLSLVGTWVAAVGAALLARRLRAPPGAAVLALWIAGVASPLLFDGYVLIAHALGAACAAIAAIALVDAVDRRGRRAVGGVVLAVAIVACVLLRTEGVFLAAGLAAAAALLAWQRRDRALLAVALVPLVAAAAAHLLESRWAASLIGGGGGSTTTPLGNATGGGVGGRVLGFVITWLLPSYSFDAAAVVTLLAAVFAIAGAVITRVRPDDRDGIVLAFGASAVMAAVRIVFAPAPVPGLLVAFPLLAVAAAVVPRSDVRTPDTRLAVGAGAAVFAALVIATQYSSGGSGEWGGRYFAIGLPLVVPLIAVAVRRLPRRPVGLLLTIATLCIAVLAVRTVRDAHATNGHLVASIMTTAAAHDAGDGGAPVVVSTNGAPARFAVDDLSRVRWLTVDRKDLATYAARLHALGIRSVTLATKERGDFDAVDGYRVAVAGEPVDGWFVGALDRS